MARVLLFWLVGDGSKYTYVSRIDDNYIIPQYTSSVYFMEGKIIDEGNGDLNELVISLPIRNEILVYKSDRTFEKTEVFTAENCNGY